MRNFKKFLALVMATLMILSAAVITTGAAEKADYTDAAQHLVALKIMKGDEKGNLMLDNGVTRYQAALFFAQAVSGETTVETWNAEKTSTVFTDVKDYGTAIDYAYTKGIIAGRGNGIFGPDDPITYQDMLVMAVRALGYETKDMAYPYGYILAAQKLDLDTDVDNVNFKAALTRGETAQIIWNMLKTEIAVEDPLSGKILYPGDKGMAETLLNKGQIERTELVKEAGFASGEFYGVITKFVEADDKNDVDTVAFDGICDSDEKNSDGSTKWYDVTFEFAAADLGITADTPKVDYLGKPMTILVDKKSDDFLKKYDVIAEDSDAVVVYTDGEDYTTVENLGNAGNIKWDAKDEILTLDGTRYTAKNNNFFLYTFKGATSDKLDAGWTMTSFDELKNNFVYTTKNGYTGENSYGKVDYYVVETDAGYKDLVYLFYTPYEFGQYFSRTLKYQPTSKDANFVTIGKYDAAGAKNLDKVDSKFVETAIGTTFKVTDGVKSIGKSNGEKAMSTKLEGETIKSGDFMFYAYNKLDNILTVAQVGSFKEGRLTSYNLNKETVKIDGTNKTVAFKGAYEIAGQFTTSDKNLCEKYDTEIAKFIRNLETGKNNVKYVELDGNVVYMEATSSKSYNEGNSFDFVIATTWDSKMADLLGYSDTVDTNGAVTKTKTDKYAEDLTKDVYIDDNGYAAIAVLDTATGKWKLASVKNFYYGDYDADNVEFAKKIDLGETAKYYDMVGDTYSKAGTFNEQTAALNGAAIFLVVNEKDGVYDLASAPAYNAGNASTPNLVAGDETTGLVFSDTAAKTNKIAANNDDDTARVTMSADTVIAVVDGNEVYVRTGVQKAKRSLNVETGKAYFLAANSSLIIMDATHAKLAGTTLATEWGASTSASATETYYVALADFSAEINTEKDDEYTVTLYNLFDLRTLKAVESITVTEDSMNKALTHKDYKAGDILHLDDDAKLTKTATTAALAAKKLADNEDNKNVTIGSIDFVDGDSIALELTDDAGNVTTVDASKATKINVKVVTLDVADLSADDYDLDNAIITNILPTDMKGADKLSKVFKNNAQMQDFKGFKAETDTADAVETYFNYNYETEVISEITEPTAGVLDNFVIYMAANGATILVPGTDVDYAEYNTLDEMTGMTKDYEALTVSLSAYAEYDSDKGTLDMVVFKIVE